MLVAYTLNQSVSLILLLGQMFLAVSWIYQRPKSQKVFGINILNKHSQLKNVQIMSILSLQTVAICQSEQSVL
jgi:hypothetical protein